MASISNAKLAGLFKRMATSYRAGLDLRTILEQESKTGSAAYRKELRIVANQINQGTTLAKAISRNEGTFPPLVLATIEAGERGGRLEESFDRLAEHYASLVSFRRNLLTLMAWPLFELAMSVGIIGLMIIVMEWVTSSQNAPSVDWLGFGKNAEGENRVSSAGYLILYMFFIAFFAFAGTFLVIGTKRGWFGIVPMLIARRIPLLGTIIVQMAMSRFAWTLGVAIDAGLSAMNSAQLALRATQNYFYTRHENDVALQIRGGDEIHESLRATGEFPEEVIMYVQNGEKAGEVPEMMKHLSDTYQERVQTNMKTLAVIGFVLTFLVVAAVIIAAIFFIFINFIMKTYNDAASGAF